MTKLELKKTDKTYYGARADGWARVTIAPIPYLAIAGVGAPESTPYGEAVGALYPLAYGIKFVSKAAGRDFTVPPLSTQWWADDPTAFTQNRRAEWRWQAMIRMPDWVDDDAFAAARAKAKTVPGLDDVRFSMVDEGDSFQTLHIGPYSAEGPKLADLHDRIMPEAHVTFAGPHHEIYLSDPRRVAPEKLRTIIRQPVRPL
ncbi:MAG: hypothetical protein CMH11_10695 [Maritimibacter sp.]|nr:hypothetical protein [Maritimibacter sp.]